MPTPASDLLTQYHSSTLLAEIPWRELSAPLQETCQQFLKSWWDNIDLDQTIEASGLSDMTIAELLIYHEKGTPQLDDHCRKRYQLISFMRIEPEDDEPMTHEEALAEKDQQELMFPENIFRVEELPEESTL